MISDLLIKKEEQQGFDFEYEEYLESLNDSKEKKKKTLQLDEEYFDILEYFCDEIGMSKKKVVHIILSEYVKNYKG